MEPAQPFGSIDVPVSESEEVADGPAAGTAFATDARWGTSHTHEAAALDRTLSWRRRIADEDRRRVEEQRRQELATLNAMFEDADGDAGPRVGPGGRRDGNGATTHPPAASAPAPPPAVGSPGARDDVDVAAIAGSARSSEQLAYVDDSTGYILRNVRFAGAPTGIASGSPGDGPSGSTGSARSPGGRPHGSAAGDSLACMPYRTPTLLVVMSVGAVFLTTLLLRLAFVTNAAVAPQSFHALVAICAAYGFGRLVLQLWGAVYPHMVGKRCLSYTTDLLPAVFAAIAVVAVVNLPLDQAQLLSPKSLPVSFKSSEMAELIARYVGLFVLVPLLFRPFKRGLAAVGSGMVVPSFGGTGGSITGPVLPTPARPAASFPRTAGSWQGSSHSLGSRAPMLSAGFASTNSLHSPFDPEAEAAADTGAASSSGGTPLRAHDSPGTGFVASRRRLQYPATSPAVESPTPATAAAVGGGTGSDGSARALEPPHSASQPRARTHLRLTTVPGAGSVASGDASGDAGTAAAVRGSEGEVDGAEGDVEMGMFGYTDGRADSPASSRGSSPSVGPRTMHGVATVQTHSTTVPHGFLPRWPSTLILGGVVLVGFIMEMWGILEATTNAWLVLLLPWAGAVVWDHFVHFKVTGSPIYVAFSLFMLMTLTNHGPGSIIAFTHSLGSYNHWLPPLVFIALGRVIIPTLWGPTASRALAAAEVWPLAFILQLVLDMLFRVQLLQMEAMSSLQVLFLVLNAAATLALDSGTFARPASTVMLPPRGTGSIVTASSYIQDRWLRAQASLFSNLVASGAVTLSVMGDVVMPYGDDGLTWNMRGQGPHVVAQLLACLVGVLAFVGVNLMMRRNLPPLLNGDHATVLDLMRNSKVLSANWDAWAGMLVSAVGYVVLRVLVTAAQMRHAYYPAAATS